MTDTFQQRDLDDRTSCTIHVLLVSHHPLIRAGLRRLVEMESGVEVVAEAGRSEEALQAAQRFSPEIALLALPFQGGIEAAQVIKAHWPATCVVALLLEDEQPYRCALLEAGASVVVSNHGHGYELLTVLHAV